MGAPPDRHLVDVNQAAIALFSAIVAVAVAGIGFLLRLGFADNSPFDWAKYVGLSWFLVHFSLVARKLLRIDGARHSTSWWTSHASLTLAALALAALAGVGQTRAEPQTFDPTLFLRGAAAVFSVLGAAGFVLALAAVMARAAPARSLAGLRRDFFVVRRRRGLGHRTSESALRRGSQFRTRRSTRCSTPASATCCERTACRARGSMACRTSRTTTEATGSSRDCATCSTSASLISTTADIRSCSFRWVFSAWGPSRSASHKNGGGLARGRRRTRRPGHGRQVEPKILGTRGRRLPPESFGQLDHSSGSSCRSVTSAFCRMPPASCRSPD